MNAGTCYLVVIAWKEHQENDDDYGGWEFALIGYYFDKKEAMKAARGYEIQDHWEEWHISIDYFCSGSNNHNLRLWAEKPDLIAEYWRGLVDYAYNFHKEK